MSNFSFLQKEWKTIYASALEAEKNVFSSPRTTCFYSRRALEQAVKWLYENDSYLQKPYNDNLGSLINEPTFKENLTPTLFPKVLVIQKIGNMSVHDNKPISDSTSFQVLKELFHFLYWLYRSYSMDDVKQNIIFDPDLIPKNQVSVISESIQKVQELEEKVKQRDAQLEQREDLLKKSQEEIDKLLAEIKQRKEQLKKIPDSHNYNEAETRKFIIDILLQEAGWDINAKDVKEYPVIGMPNNQETGFVDYVLWGDNGLPLAVIEAKKTSKDPKIGRQQSKLYADCLEQMK